MTTTVRWGALTLLLTPLGAWALGLGDITLNSALNQPLVAEIQLVSATPEELSNLRVSVASQATFDRYGLERPAYFSGIDFRVGTNNLGRPVILMTSRQAVSEPFLTVLVEVGWSRGRLLREYTVLLDPPLLLPVPETTRTIEPAETGAPDTTRPAAAINRPTLEPIARPTEQAAPRAEQSAQPTARATPPAVRATSPTTQAVPPRQTGEPIRATAATPPGGSYGPVRPAETLWSIAAQYRPAGITMNQMIVALYRANPQAFGGNMNTLHQGVTLRIPPLAELDAISTGEATAEALRQAALWEGGGAEQPARLRLVTPASTADTATASGGSVAATTTEIAELEGELNMVRDELDYNRRLLEIKDQQLQDLQTQLAAAQDVQSRPADPVPDSQLFAEAGVDLESEALFADEAVPLPETTPVISEPAVVAPSAAATRVVTTPSQPSLTSRMLGWWTQFRGWLSNLFGGLTETLGGLTQGISWLTGPILLIGVGLIALAGTAMLFLRRRQPDAGDAAGEWDSDSLDTELEGAVDTLVATGRLRQPVESDEPGFLVEEQSVEPAASEPMPELGEVFEPEPDPEPTMEPLLDPTLEEMLTSELDPALDPGPDPEPTLAPGDGSASISRTMTIGKPDEQPSFDDTISSQTLINLEQADPVAEADFHMAYGLYDQAAELVEKALVVDPGRRDLKLKLLEVFFVWGNKESFVDTAQALRAEIGSGPDSEWDKVVIMGKQICPDNALFSAATASAGAVDVDLEAGESPSLDMAFDLDAGGDDGTGLGLEAGDTDDSAGQGLDLGAQTLAGLETAIFERPDGVDDATSPNLDADILAATEDSATLNMPAEPSVEVTGFESVGADLGDSLESTGDQSAEITLEDLGLEDGTLAGLADADILSSSGVDEVLEESAAETETHGTATGIALDLDDLVSALGDDDTVAEPVAQTVGSDVLAGTETDLNLDTTSDQSGLLDPSTMTMTEVGTKLDLARAYVDMGDSDGARAILEEVVVEGDPGQQQEAQTLIDGL